MSLDRRLQTSVSNRLYAQIARSMHALKQRGTTASILLRICCTAVQKRRAVPKSKRFDDLQSTSGVQGRVLVDNCPVGMPSALCSLSVQPYGQDPVFNPFSDIFDDDLPGLEGNYYNTTTVSGFSSRKHDVFSKRSANTPSQQ